MKVDAFITSRISFGFEEGSDARDTGDQKGKLGLK